MIAKQTIIKNKFSDVDIFDLMSPFPPAEDDLITAGLKHEDDESSGVPALLKAYHDAADELEALKDRFVSMQVDHDDALERRRDEPILSTLEDTQSLKDFSRNKSALRRDLRAAQEKAAETWKQCTDLGLIPLYSDSKGYMYRDWSSTESERAASPDVFTLPPKGSPTLESLFLSHPRHVPRPYAASNMNSSRDPSPCFVAVPDPSTEEWVTGQERLSKSRYDRQARTTNRSDALSVASLPERGRVDDGPAEERTNDDGSTRRARDREQARHRMDVPSRRKLKDTRPMHSESSM